MNWDVAAALGEIAGAIGVIISLVYLAAQIRQNSKWVEASVAETTAGRSINLTSMVASDPELSHLVRVGLSEQANELDPDEKHRFGLVLITSLRGHEVSYANYRSGLLGKSSFDGFATNMSMWMDSPLFEDLWNSANAIFEPEFVEMVNELKNKRKEVPMYDVINKSTD